MRRRQQSGMTLIEAVIALVVMTTALAAIFGMINNVQGANQTLDFQNVALDAFSRISAQIRDARCDYQASDTVTPGINAASTDPGLTAAQGAGWFGGGGPTAGSSITFVGDGTNNAELAQYSTPIRVEYRTQATPPPPPSVVGYNTRFLVEVRIRELKRDPTLDDPARVDGHWIRVFPVEKVCVARTDAVGRGEFQ